MTRIAIFGYGSLADPASAARTLNRAVTEPLPARARGWRRRWTLVRDNLRSEKTFALESSGDLPPYVLGLNLELADSQDNSEVNGALVEVSATELDRLDRREIRYRRVDLTGAVATAVPHGFDRVIAYRARDENHAPAPPEGAVVLVSYLRAVEAAFDLLGPGELERFRASTGDPPVPVVEGKLVRDAIPAGNPREW
jgi:hypothetical protein